MRKKDSQLVCEYLENVSREVLEEHQHVIRKFVGRRSGVYALYNKKKLHYVGLASSLLSRLKGHLRDQHSHTWDRFSVYLTVGPRYMREIELLLIRISNPPGNKAKGKFVNANHLINKVKAEYRRCEKEKQQRLFNVSKLTPKQEPLKSDKINVSRTVLWDYRDKLSRLRATYKGKTFHARVLKNGQISFKGKRYNSPSLAAAVACKKPTFNGWWLWHYEKAPGFWERLSELRQ